MTAERTKKDAYPHLIATPESITVAGDQVLVGWDVNAHDIDSETAGDIISEATGGEIISQQRASEIMSQTGSKTYSLGYRGNHKNKSTWEPSGSAWTNKRVQ